MQIGAIASSPYVYNTNSVSSASLKPISGIGSDVTSEKIDYSGLTSGETTNPLSQGESSNFMDVLAMQMNMGKINASRIMQPTDDTSTTSDTGADAQQAGGVTAFQMSQAMQAYSTSMMDIA